MIEWVKKHKDILAYLFFGALTTGVNYLIYFPCYNLLGCSAGVSNGLAWIIAVGFAFLTNKPFVFQSHDWSWQVVWPELTKFVSCRIGSGLLEMGILLAGVYILNWNGNLTKLLTGILVILLNYVGSKFLIFKKH